MKRMFLLLSLSLLLVLAGCAGQEPAQQETEQPDQTVSDQTTESQETEKLDEPAEPQETEEPSQEESEEPEKEPVEPAEPDQEEPEEPEESSQETAKDAYAACTSLPAEEVDAFAAQVRQAVVSRDWDRLAEMVCYDIKVWENTFADSAEFAAADWDSIFSEDFLQAIEEEPCQDMFCNWQGVMMGDGQIWFSEVLDIDGNSEGLKVVAINLEA